MTFFQYILLSFIQAVTEFLPVSSSGHLLLFKGIFNSENLPIIFDITVHFGSVIAIILFYRKKLISLLKESILEIKNKEKEKNSSKFILYILISTFITGVIYLLSGDIIEQQFHNPDILKYTFLFTSILLISTKFNNKNKYDIIKIGLLLPVLVGIFQGIALFPGISRSGSTIAIMLLLGIKGEDAAFFSFSIAIPAIIGGTLIDFLKMESLTFLSQNAFILIISFAVSMIFSILFLNLLSRFLKKGQFWYFSIYTGILAVISLLLFR